MTEPEIVWTPASFAIVWYVGEVTELREVAGCVWDIRGLDQRDEEWTLTHLPTGRAVYNSFWSPAPATAFLQVALPLAPWDTADTERPIASKRTIARLKKEMRLANLRTATPFDA